VKFESINKAVIRLVCRYLLVLHIQGGNMELFLTSYLAGTKKLAEDFLSDLKVKEIVFIPTASNVESYTKYVDEAIDTFRDLGYSLNILDISKREYAEIIDILDVCECLYISGGNTFYLLQELKKKELCELIRQRVSNGMLYMGESAGAIISAPDIEYNHIMDDKTVAKELKDYSGLALVDFYTLPHNKEYPFVESTEEILKVYKDKLKLLPINNEEAIIVKDGKVEVKKEPS
jgi:peptidase, S51 family